MKKLATLLIVALLPLITYAQNSIFDKFEDMDEVTTVVVTQEAFKMLAQFKGGGEEGEEYLDMVKGLTSFRVFTTEDSGIAKQMSDVVNKYLGSAKLTELMRVKDKDANVKVYVRQGKDETRVSELLMFVSGMNGDYKKDLPERAQQEAVILSLTGDIDLTKISKLTEAHIPNAGIKVKEAKQ